MSVEKVNKYKEEKKNRKEILEKEKKKKRLAHIGGWAAGLVLTGALVVLLGLTAKNAYKDYQDSKPNYNAESMVVTDMTGILDTLESEAETPADDASGETKAE
ncbi:MAG: hypothetical protein Q4F21_00140 [Lachnospiraceae bacterium]|nr:hypothetical protein [Lachnospiraceae bacterium]